MAAVRKNIAVGATVLGALILLGAMILRFGDAPVKWFQSGQVPVTFSAESAEGISNGSPIFFLGVNVGKVDSVTIGPDSARVLISGQIDKTRNVPANVEGVIRGTLIGGASSLNLELTGNPPVASKQTVEPNAQLKARSAGSGLIPPEVSALAKRLSELSMRLEITVDDLNKSGAVKKLAQTLDSIQVTVTKAGEALDDAHKLIGDPKIQSDLKETLANFRSVSENAKVIGRNIEKVSADFDKLTTDATLTINKTGMRIDEVSKSLAGRLDQTAQILEKFQVIATRIEKGDGTAGKLINDPKLYEALVSSSQELNLTIKDLRRLVEQWEQEGVTLKLGGKGK